MAMPGSRPHEMGVGGQLAGQFLQGRSQCRREPPTSPQSKVVAFSHKIGERMLGDRVL